MLSKVQAHNIANRVHEKIKVVLALYRDNIRNSSEVEPDFTPDVLPPLPQSTLPSLDWEIMSIIFPAVCELSRSLSTVLINGKYNKKLTNLFKKHLEVRKARETIASFAFHHLMDCYQQGKNFTWKTLLEAVSDAMEMWFPVAMDTAVEGHQVKVQFEAWEEV